MKNIIKTALIAAPLLIASCSEQSDVKFPDFSSQGQTQAMKVHEKFVTDCENLVAKDKDKPDSVWNVSPDKVDSFCDCTSTKVVSKIPEDKLESALSDIKRARGIPMLPMAVHARFGDDAKSTVSACK